MKNQYNKAIFCAILAAILYALSSPICKILLLEVPPVMLAGLLYLGAGIGMSVTGLFQYKTRKLKETNLTRSDLPFIILMIILDILAPVFLMWGLFTTTPENVSLLNNFEIVATSIIALFIFKETISKKLWLAIGLITAASFLLSINDTNSFSFSKGSVLVILATIFWGLENNCTKMLSIRNPLQVVIIKGFGSGIGTLIIAFIIKQISFDVINITAALFIGFISYGLSIFFYISAQRQLGAAKTSAFYAVSPFIGVFLSFLIFNDIPNYLFFISFIIMIFGTYFAVFDK